MRPSLKRHHLWPWLGLLAPYAVASGTVAGGYLIAATAAELRIEHGCWALIVTPLAGAISLALSTRTRPFRLIRGVAVAMLAMLGLVEVAAELSFTASEPSTALLWGGPLHMAVAASCFVVTITGLALHPHISALSALASLLGGLGLL